MPAFDILPHLTLAQSVHLYAMLADETRLRLLLLLDEAELTVSDLMAITGQSQPRLSRHLRLLVDAGLLVRHAEGSSVFFKTVRRGALGAFVRGLLAAVGGDDAQTGADRQRLAARREERTLKAQAFFNEKADLFKALQETTAPDERIMVALARILGQGKFATAIDLGTGSGTMLVPLTRHAHAVIGLDQSPKMLAVARAKLDGLALALAPKEAHQLQAAIDFCQGDIFALPYAKGACDLAMMHMVLHYFEEPSRAITAVAKLLAPQGRLILVDFASHGHEALRKTHGHQRLGFAREEVLDFFSEAGLTPQEFEILPAPSAAQSAVQKQAQNRNDMLAPLAQFIACGQNPKTRSDQGANLHTIMA